MSSSSSSSSSAAVAEPVDEAVTNAAAHKLMDLSQQLFELTLSDERVPEKAATLAAVLAQIEADNMAPLYASLCQERGWALDEALLARMKAANAAEVAKLDASVADAKEKFGDVEVYDRRLEKARYLTSIGDKAGALEVYAVMTAAGSHVSTGQLVDIAMAKSRLALQHGDFALARTLIAEGKALNDKGGDWDRRNRLKVYEGVAALAARDFAGAAALLLDSVATFTAHEVASYDGFVFLAVLAALKTLDRVALKRRVVDSPDVLASLDAVPHLGALLASLYECRYRDFFAALTDIYPAIVRCRYTSAHAPYFLREMRIAAYTQFLTSYKSVTIAGMSRTFGVTPAFLDAELSRFIASGRIAAKIDAVAGIIETSRPDAKNVQFQQVIKIGDAILNKVQKLSRAAAL